MHDRTKAARPHGLLHARTASTLTVLLLLFAPSMLHHAAAQKPPVARGPFGPVPPELTQALAGEQPAIKAAAKLMNNGKMREAQAAMGEIMRRIGKRLSGPMPPMLPMVVLQAVQTARVAAAAANGQVPGYGPLPANVPDFVRQAMTGQPTQDLAQAALLNPTDPVASAAALQKGMAGMAEVTRMLNATGGPAQAAEAARMFRFQIDLAVNAAVKAPSDAATVASAFGALVSRRAETLEVERRISAGLKEADRDTVAKARAGWFVLNDGIAALELQRANDVTLTAEETTALAKKKQDSAKLLGMLARASQRGRSQDAEIEPTTAVPDLRATLRAGEALLSYAQYGTGQGKGVSAYAVFVLTKSDLQLVDLGPAAAIEGAVGDFLEAVGRRATPFDRKVQAARALHDRVFAPVVSKLGAGVNQLRVVGDGALQLVPFAALHDGTDFLIAARRFTYATAERDLLPRYWPPANPTPPLVIADLPYGKGAVAFAKRFTPQDFPALANTAAEAKAVGTALPGARVATGPISEPAFLRMRAPRVLHIAAHGVFLPFPLAPDVPAADRGVLVARREQTVALPDTTTKDHGDPLARAALVLSASKSPKTDGFLTALEVSALDLWGTELVVLSACDTGRGRIGAAQGVRGFRSAFASAGARSLVTGLWTVDDEATAVLMTDFYGALGKNAGRGGALHDAMLATRKTQADPYFWAPFILLGEDGPLGTSRAAPVAAATPATGAAPANPELARRLKRGIEFRRTQRGEAKSAGTGSWSLGGREDQLLDAVAKRKLGPRRNNLILTLQGMHSALSFMIDGYRGPGTYAIGGRGSNGVLYAVSDPLDADPSEMSPMDPQPRISGTVRVLRDAGGHMSGILTLKGAPGAITGSFDVLVDP